MKVLELTINLYITNDMQADEVQSSICELIDRTLVKDKNFAELHSKNTYKNYVFDSLVPFNKVYKRGDRARFKIRTVDAKLAAFLRKGLEGMENNNLLVIFISDRVVPMREIESIRTVTPVTLTTEKGYWRNSLSSKDFEDKLISNLLKKYNKFTGEKVECNFEDVFTSYTEEATHLKRFYKKNMFLTDKIMLTVSNSDIAQKLAYFALGVGLLEKNSRGFGFMQYTFTEE